MVRREAYGNAERIIEEARLSGQTALDLRGIGISEVPESLAQLTQLKKLYLSSNELSTLPDFLGQLTQLQWLDLSYNKLSTLPDSLGQLTQLQALDLSVNELSTLPAPLGDLKTLVNLHIDNNPLNPELAAASAEGLEALQRFLRAMSAAQVPLTEAKLVLIGEGAVGKSCLLGALRGDDWEEDRPTTHGIEIKPVKVIDSQTGMEITLNGWDFGGQPVYRPTHQLFFTAPAVYLVVWKPREGQQQGFVEDWIRLVKHRAPEARIIVVATHGGPGQCLPDINRQDLWDRFGKDTVSAFFHIESKPDDQGVCAGIDELKSAIARTAASLPEMGRSVPKSWNDARRALKETGSAHVPLGEVLAVCKGFGMTDDEARDFVAVSHRLGHLVHYEHDPTLRGIVVLKPDWLATAISLVLDDGETRENRGLVRFEHLSRVWNDPYRKEETRYSPDLHPVFLRLMERFGISYRVGEAGGLGDDKAGGISLVAQLVPDNRPDPLAGWVDYTADGDEERVQICRIVDADNGESAVAEGIFYQLIVRLHRYSLGKHNYHDSVHWQRGLVLDDDYNGRALLEHVANDLRVTVRAPYPERFLSVLTNEVRWLVEHFWKGLRCDVMVPCIEPCGRKRPGMGLFKVADLISSKKRQISEFPCPVCSKWQDIDSLLRNAPAAQQRPLEQLIVDGFNTIQGQLAYLSEGQEGLGRDVRRVMSQVDDMYTRLMQALTDEATEGPRLFSFQPIDPGFLDRPRWVSLKIRLTLWCEHSRLPLPALNGPEDGNGVYDLTLPRDWLVKATPFLKVLTGALSFVLPIAVSSAKFALDDTTWKTFEKQLDLGNKTLDSVLKGADKAIDWMVSKDASNREYGEAIKAHGSVLRELHYRLKEKDPASGFGGLVRVQNKRGEFLWVHQRFAEEY